MWAASLPKSPSMSWHPLPLLSIPASPSIVQTETAVIACWQCLLFEFGHGISLYSKVISINVQMRISSPTPPSSAGASAAGFSVPDLSEELFARRLARQCLQRTQPTTPFSLTHARQTIGRLSVSRGSSPIALRPKKVAVSDIISFLICCGMQRGCIIPKTTMHIPLQRLMLRTSRLQKGRSCRDPAASDGLFAKARICLRSSCAV